MPPDTVITWGLGGAFIGAATVGFGVAIWIVQQLRSIRNELMKAIAESRRDGDERLALVSAKVDLYGTKLAEHQLHVEQRFVTKDTANLVFQRLESAVAETRQAIESRLIRMEDRLERAASDRGKEDR